MGQKMPKLFLNHLLYGTFASAVVMAMGALVLEATRWSPISTHKGTSRRCALQHFLLYRHANLETAPTRGLGYARRSAHVAGAANRRCRSRDGF